METPLIKNALKACFSLNTMGLCKRRVFLILLAIKLREQINGDFIKGEGIVRADHKFYGHVVFRINAGVAGNIEVKRKKQVFVHSEQRKFQGRLSCQRLELQTCFCPKCDNCL